MKSTVAAALAVLLGLWAASATASPQSHCAGVLCSQNPGSCRPSYSYGTCCPTWYCNDAHGQLYTVAGSPVDGSSSSTGYGNPGPYRSSSGYLSTGVGGGSRAYTAALNSDLNGPHNHYHPSSERLAIDRDRFDSYGRRSAYARGYAYDPYYNGSSGVGISTGAALIWPVAMLLKMAFQA